MQAPITFAKNAKMEVASDRGNEYALLCLKLSQSLASLRLLRLELGMSKYLTEVPGCSASLWDSNRLVLHASLISYINSINLQATTKELSHFQLNGAKHGRLECGR